MLLIILETCSESLQDEGREFWGRDTAQEQLCRRIEKNFSSLHLTEGNDALRQHQHKFRLKPRLPALGFQTFGECL